MEPMHLATIFAIQRDLRRTTAFSARPDSPVQPVIAPRRLDWSGLARLRRLLPRRRRALRHVLA